MHNDTPSYFLVDKDTKERFESAYTMKGIHAKVIAGNYKVLARQTNNEYGFDLLVELDK